MSEKKLILTKEGLEKLENELNELKIVRRKEVAEKIKEARGQGDLSENAEYDAAKDKQAEIEAEIARIEDILTRAKIIRANNNKNEVHLGSTVTYKKGSNEETVVIVPEAEFDPLAEPIKVGANAPFATAIMGAKIGDEVTIPGLKNYKIKILKLA